MIKTRHREPFVMSGSKRTNLRLFPFLKDSSKAQDLKIDEASKHYISVRGDSEKITTTIASFLKDLKITSNITITDATAGVGGNAISFAQSFSWVNAIEIDPLRAEYLQNNANIYQLRNIQIINDDCLNQLRTIRHQNVVFIDPPWGGKSYKEHKMLRLKLSNMTIESICNMLLNKSSEDEPIMYSPEVIVLKLPKNYDIPHLRKTVHSSQIWLHPLNKMYVVVIVNEHKLPAK